MIIACGLILVYFLLKSILEKEVPSIKLMMLGISIILTGGIFVLDNSSYLGGFEYVIVISGLVISLIGFSRFDR